MAYIEIKNISFKYKLGNKQALKSIDVSIDRGDLLLVCGKSGCGKTTLLRMLKPNIMPAGEMTGNIIFDGKDIKILNDRELASDIGFVMQNPSNQMVTDKVWHEISFGMENLGMTKAAMRLRVAEIAEYLNIGNLLKKDVDKLSGGQKQLVNLASILAMNPKVLILDEPTAWLDPIAAECFIDMVRKINEDLGITVIICEHRLNYILPYATKVLLMDDGKIIAAGNPKDIVGTSMDDEMIKLMPVPSQMFKMANAKGDIPVAVSQGRKWIEENIEGFKYIKENKDSKESDVLLECKHLWFRYEKKLDDILKDLNLKVYRGEIFGLLGGNGAGKTTTVSILAGLLKPYRGKVKAGGRIAMLPQDVQTLFTKDTVREELENVSEELIKSLKVDTFFDMHPYDISGGEQQCVAIAKVLNTNPDILIMDEPTKGIDGIYKDELGNLLKNYVNQGKAVIMVSHDVDFCGEYVDRCGLFDDGSIIGTESARDFFSENNYYTTTVHKMSRNVIDKGICKEDVLWYLDQERTI